MCFWLSTLNASPAPPIMLSIVPRIVNLVSIHDSIYLDTCFLVSVLEPTPKYTPRQYRCLTKISNWIGPAYLIRIWIPSWNWSCQGKLITCFDEQVIMRASRNTTLMLTYLIFTQFHHLTLFFWATVHYTSQMTRIIRVVSLNIIFVLFMLGKVTYACVWYTCALTRYLRGGGSHMKIWECKWP